MSTTRMETLSEKNPDIKLEEGSSTKEEEWSEDIDARAELARTHTELEHNLPFWQTVKLYWRAIFWILFGQLNVFGYGIDGVIAAYLLAIPRFRQDFGQAYVVDGEPAYIISATWISIFSGVAQLTAIIGALSTGYIADKIGRKLTTLITCVISVAAVGVQYSARGSLPILCVGKGLNGFPIGAWLVIGPLYASEVAPLKLRGWLTAMTNIIQFSGVLLFTGVVYVLGPENSSKSYQIPFACQWIVPSIVLLTIYFWPESPTWLLRMGKREAAMKSIEKIYGAGAEVNRKGLLAQLEHTLAQEKAGTAAAEKDSKGYLECFQKPHRQRTLISMWVYGCQYLGGLIFVLGYQSYYYQLIGFTAKKSFFLTMLNNVFQFIANIISWWLISVLGRRPLIVYGELCGAICLFIIAGCSTIGTHTGYLATVAFMFIWAFTYQLTLGTVAWSVVAEIPSLRLRARTQGLANLTLCFTQWLIGFVFPYMFNPDAGNMGGKVGFVFGATSFIGFLGVMWYLPETKNRTAAELDKLYEKKIPARKFHKIKVEEL